MTRLEKVGAVLLAFGFVSIVMLIVTGIRMGWR
jgi:hypothetical protein